MGQRQRERHRERSPEQFDFDKILRDAVQVCESLRYRGAAPERWTTGVSSSDLIVLRSAIRKGSPVSEDIRAEMAAAVIEGSRTTGHATAKRSSSSALSSRCRRRAACRSLKRVAWRDGPR